MVTYKITRRIDNNLEDADNRLSVTSRARYESQEITRDSYREWMDIIVNFYITNPQAFISDYPTDINLAKNDLFPLYIDERAIENALEMQYELLSEARAKVEEIVKASTLSVNEIKYNTLDRGDIIYQLEKKLIKIVSFYNEYNEYVFSLSVPNDADITTDFDKFETWAREKLNLSNDYRLLTGDVVESIEENEIEHHGGLAWYRIKSIRPKTKKKTSNLSDTEQDYINKVKSWAERVSKITDPAILMEYPTPLYSPREKAVYYGVEKEYDLIAKFLDEYDEYSTVINDLLLFVKKGYKGTIFIDKTQLGDKVGLFIGKQGKNIKKLSQEVGRKIILR